MIEKQFRIGGGEIVQVRHPTHSWPMVRMRLKCRGVELFQQSPNRATVGAHAALLNHDVSLFVKLSHHRVEKSLGFEISPKFKSVDRERIVITGFVIIGECVQILTAALFDDFAELVRNHIFIRRGSGVFPVLF